MEEEEHCFVFLLRHDGAAVQMHPCLHIYLSIYLSFFLTFYNEANGWRDKTEAESDFSLLKSNFKRTDPVRPPQMRQFIEKQMFCPKKRKQN